MKNKSFLSRKVKNNIFAYLMLLPDMLGIALFIFIPILIALYVSFHEWNALEPMRFVGLDNYKTMLQDTDWQKSLLITVCYTALFVPLLYCVSLGLALLIQSIKGKVQHIFRTVLFLPYSVSTVVAALIWRFMLDPRNGFFNQILRFFHIPIQGFLGNTKQALLCIAVISVWMLCGYYAIIFLAGIKDIPKSYYEAACLDGADELQTFFYITFPLLKEVSVFVIVVTTISSFQVFDLVKILTNGGPAQSTTVSVFYIYQNAFDFTKLGYSSAMAFVLFVLIMLFSLIQLRLTGEVAKK